MKIVKIWGGLGNQMFQYALYLKLCEIYSDVKLDITAFRTYALHNGFELERVFEIEKNYANKEEINLVSRFIPNYQLSRIVRKILKNKKTEIFEKSNYYVREILENRDKIDFYLEGYWQNYNYFNDIRNLVLRIFTFKNIIDDKNIEILKKIESENSVSLHIRGGDYLTNKKSNNAYGGICTKEYYQRAINYIRENIADANFYVFSNDFEWVKENLEMDGLFTLINWNFGEKSYIDMCLMSKCKYNIIANSSFSWWGAWLNQNTNKIVISPKYWKNTDLKYTEGLIPENWIKL